MTMAEGLKVVYFLSCGARDDPGSNRKNLQTFIYVSQLKIQASNGN